MVNKRLPEGEGRWEGGGQRQGERGLEGEIMRRSPRSPGERGSSDVSLLPAGTLLLVLPLRKTRWRH